MTFGVVTRAFFISLAAFSAGSASPAARYLQDSGQAVSNSFAASVEELSLANGSGLSRRWDGSPAMGRELDAAKGKACSLWSMMHLDDAKAGQHFSPPRAKAHSNYLQLEGETFRERLSTRINYPTDLTKWAYVTKPPRKDPKCDMGNGKDMYGLQTILEAKGVSAAKKDWECVRITHGDPEHKTISIDAQTYTNPRTGQTARVRSHLFRNSLIVLF